MLERALIRSSLQHSRAEKREPQEERLHSRSDTSSQISRHVNIVVLIRIAGTGYDRLVWLFCCASRTILVDQLRLPEPQPVCTQPMSDVPNTQKSSNSPRTLQRLPVVSELMGRSLDRFVAIAGQPTPDVTVAFSRCWIAVQTPSSPIRIDARSLILPVVRIRRILAEAGFRVAKTV